MCPCFSAKEEYKNIGVVEPKEEPKQPEKEPVTPTKIERPEPTKPIIDNKNKKSWFVEMLERMFK
jgi:hypothetical protein